MSIKKLTEMEGIRVFAAYNDPEEITNEYT